MDDLSNLEKLIIRLIPKLMAGGATEFGEYGATYMKQICRLIDKAVWEYEITRKHWAKDAFDSQALHMFEIMNHLENSINATRRALLFMDKIKAEKTCLPVPRLQARLISTNSTEIVRFRNSIEHFDERIRTDNGPVLLSVDPKGSKAVLGKSELQLEELSEILKRLHSIVHGLITESL